MVFFRTVSLVYWFFQLVGMEFEKWWIKLKSLYTWSVPLLSERDRVLTRLKVALVGVTGSTGSVCLLFKTDEVLARFKGDKCTLLSGFFLKCCSDYLLSNTKRDRRYRDRQVVGFSSTYGITNKDSSSNPAHGEVYSIQHYVIKFVSDLRQISDFHWVLRFPPPIKLTTTI